MKSGSNWPSRIAIAVAKAEAFGKIIVQHAGSLAAQFHLLEPQLDVAFAINNSSSRFRSGQEIIHLKGTAKRKMLLDKMPFGQVIRAVWHKGRGKFDIAAEFLLHQAFNQFDKQMMPEMSRLMPAWINDNLIES